MRTIEQFQYPSEPVFLLRYGHKLFKIGDPMSEQKWLKRFHYENDNFFDLSQFLRHCNQKFENWENSQLGFLYTEKLAIINLITEKTRTVPSKSKKLWWGHTFPVLEPLNLKIGALQQETSCVFKTLRPSY